MVRLDILKRRILTAEDFDKYPVWTWDEAMENVQPISETEPSIKDYVDLFIKATFTSDDYTFQGYLMGGDYFYGFVIFINTEKFMFNINLPDYNTQHLNLLFKCLKCTSFNFFPVRYESDVTLKETGKIAGILDFKE